MSDDGFDKNFKTFYAQAKRFDMGLLEGAFQSVFEKVLDSEQLKKGFTDLKENFLSAKLALDKYMDYYTKTFEADPEGTLEDWRIAMQDNWEAALNPKAIEEKDFKAIWLKDTNVTIKFGADDDAQVRLRALFFPIHVVALAARNKFVKKYGVNPVIATVEQLSKHSSDEAKKMSVTALSSYKMMFLIYKTLYFVAPEEQKVATGEIVNKLATILGFDRHVLSQEEVQKKFLEENRKLLEGALSMAAGGLGGEAGEGMKKMLEEVLNGIGMNKIMELGAKSGGKPAQFQELFQQGVKSDKSLISRLEAMAEEVKKKADAENAADEMLKNAETLRIAAEIESKRRIESPTTPEASSSKSVVVHVAAPSKKNKGKGKALSNDQITSMQTDAVTETPSVEATLGSDKLD